MFPGYLVEALASYPAELCSMVYEYDNITVTESGDGAVLWLPDGSSVEVPQDTIHRSAVLQEAVNTSDVATNETITLPQGILQDWLQSIDALKAAAASTAGTDIVHHPRLIHFLKVRCCSFLLPCAVSHS